MRQSAPVTVVGVLLVSVALCPSAGCKTAYLASPSGLTAEEEGGVMMALMLAEDLLEIPQVRDASAPPRIGLLDIANQTRHPVDTELLTDLIQDILERHTRGRVVFPDRHWIMSLIGVSGERDLAESRPSEALVAKGMDYVLTGYLTEDMRGRWFYSLCLIDTETSLIIWVKKYAPTSRAEVALPEGVVVLREAWSAAASPRAAKAAVESPRGPLHYAQQLLDRGDVMYLHGAYERALEFYEQAVASMAKHDQRPLARTAAWRRMMCAMLLDLGTVAQNEFRRTFGRRTEKNAGSLLASDYIALWVVGRIEDKQLVNALEEFSGDRGTSKAWFLIGERRRSEGDEAGALEAYQRSEQAQVSGSAHGPWTAAWARRRWHDLSINKAIIDRVCTEQESYEAIVESICHDGFLRESVRKRALGTLNRRFARAEELQRTAWRVVGMAGATLEDYECAVQAAREACSLFPLNALYARTLGVAQYRAGQYEHALETLTLAHKLDVEGGKGEHPADHAFLAMTLYSLGRHDEAYSELTHLRRTMEQAPWSKDEDARSFLRETEMLLERPSTQFSND